MVENNEGTEGTSSFEELTTEELTELALSAEMTPEFDSSLPPFVLHRQYAGATLLPEWYMPGAVSRIRSKWRVVIVAAIVALLFGIEISGLCSVFGQLVVG